MQGQNGDRMIVVRIIVDHRLYDRHVVGNDIVVFARIRRMHIDVEGKRFIRREDEISAV